MASISIPDDDILYGADEAVAATPTDLASI